MRRLLAYIFLWPLWLLYGGVVLLRNWLYDRGYFHSYSFEVKTVVVGNLSMGGTGKSPLVLWLADQLKQKHQVATLSRGYGRRTRGFRLATELDDATAVGDEPLMYFHRLGGQVPVAVAEARAEGIPFLVAEHPQLDVVVLDDAYQHRQVQGDVNLLLTTWQRPFVTDQLLPFGRLREPRRGAHRADAVVVTKVPETVDEEQLAALSSSMKSLVRPEVPVFFLGLAYGQLRTLFSDQPQTQMPQRVVLLTAIAQPQPLRAYLDQHTTVVRHMDYPDHFQFRQRQVAEVARSLQQAGEGVALVTTEKDRMRLLPFAEELKTFACYYLPLQLTFRHGADQLLMDLIEDRLRP